MTHLLPRLEDLQAHAYSARVYMHAALKDTENLPEGMDRATIVAALIHAAATTAHDAAIYHAAETHAGAITYHADKVSTVLGYISNILEDAHNPV
jgi:hypothetical protein